MEIRWKQYADTYNDPGLLVQEIESVVFSGKASAKIIVRRPYENGEGTYTQSYHIIESPDQVEGLVQAIKAYAALNGVVA